MPRSFKWLFAIHILLFSLTACELSPDVVICNDGTPPVIKTPTTIKEVATILGAPVQVFTYNPALQNSFTSAQGTSVVIPAHAFVDENGRPITTPVHVQFREIFDKGAMVLSAMPTISDGRALESAGELYLAPEEKVKWADSISVTLQTQIPASVTSMIGMQLFAATNPTTSRGSCFNWLPLANSSINTASGTASYKVSSAVFNAGYHWINCDRFLPEVPKDTIIATVQGSNIDSTRNTMAYVMFRKNNTVLELCQPDGLDKLKSPGIPLGSSVSIIVIQVKDEKMYYGRKDTVVNSKINVQPILMEISSQALKDSLKRM